jgi:hypothetical protein
MIQGMGNGVVRRSENGSTRDGERSGTQVWKWRYMGRGTEWYAGLETEVHGMGNGVVRRSGNGGTRDEERSSLRG